MKGYSNVYNNENPQKVIQVGTRILVSMALLYLAEMIYCDTIIVIIN